MKKLTGFKAILLMLLAVLTLFTGAKEAQAAKKTYLDVAESDWYYSAVDYVSGRNYMSGYTNGKFGPSDSLTRGQIATILYRMAGSPDILWSVPYDDVVNDAYYTVPVCWVTQQGLMSGYSINNNFGPNDPITREQLVTVMFRWADKAGIDVSARASLDSFPDADRIQSFSGEALQFAVAKGIITGNNGKLDPQGKAVRAQAAVILQKYRALVTDPEEKLRELTALVKTNGDNTSMGGVGFTCTENLDGHYYIAYLQWSETAQQLQAGFGKTDAGEEENLVTAVGWNYGADGTTDGHLLVGCRKMSGSMTIGYVYEGYMKSPYLENVTGNYDEVFTIVRNPSGYDNALFQEKCRNDLYRALSFMSILMEKEGLGTLKDLGFVSYAPLVYPC